MSYDFVPANLAIKAMRSNGFKSTDYAISELIDNSIQASIQAGHETCEVEVICIEERVRKKERTLSQITKIIIADNSGGMSPEVLRRALMFGAGTNLEPSQQKGIGKFGMGLPNSSISQCKLVEVYSWQNGKCFLTSLDVARIEQNELKEVPEPQLATIPDYIQKLTKCSDRPGGTIVVWSDLDKTTWVRHQAFFKNSEFLVGRMYRNFLIDNRSKITFRAYESHSGRFDMLSELNVRPNDPLMLMTGTSAPAPFDKRPAFEQHGPAQILTVQMTNGIKSEVEIKFSVASQEARAKGPTGLEAGHLPHGKYAARNAGVSIVRAGRELELNTSWVKPSDPTERWWAVEINFEPELDEIFGVTNNKQAATNLYAANIKEDADNLGLKQSEYEAELFEADDPKLQTYKISKAIDSRLASIRKHINKQNNGSDASNATSSGAAERRASRVADERSNSGQISSSDKARLAATEEQRTAALVSQLKEIGTTEEDASRIAIQRISDDIRFSFGKAALSSAAFFEANQECGEYLIKFNERHPVFSEFIKLLDKPETADSAEFVGLKLLLCAWARMEDEAEGREKDVIEDLRQNWGKFAREFMRVD